MARRLVRQRLVTDKINGVCLCSPMGLRTCTGSARVVATRSVEVEHAEGIKSDSQRA
jgi:hypothetical protein